MNSIRPTHTTLEFKAQLEEELLEETSAGHSPKVKGHDPAQSSEISPTTDLRVEDPLLGCSQTRQALGQFDQFGSVSRGVLQFTRHSVPGDKSTVS